MCTRTCADTHTRIFFIVQVTNKSKRYLNLRPNAVSAIKEAEFTWSLNLTVKN